MSEASPTVARFGATAVPWTVSWSGEEEFFLGPCPQFGRPAIRQVSAPGVGKPLFGKPHMDRQRSAMARCLCDLCGKPLKRATKVGLSHARPMPHGAEGWAVLQVEPLLHRACALESMRFCPSLKTQLADGTLRIRQVTRWRAQCAIMTETFTMEQVGKPVRALGHGKIELLKWIDRDLAWLEKGPTQ